MDEGFDFDAVDVSIDDSSFDVPDIEVETFDDIGVDFDSSGDFGGTDIDSLDIELDAFDDLGDTEVETAIETTDLTELQQEYDDLGVEPFDEEVLTDDNIDLGMYDNIGDADFSPFDEETTTEQFGEPSALSNILEAGAEGLYEPSDLAQNAGAFSPPGAEDATAQLIQAGWNAGVTGSEEFMEATIDQHGRSPSVEYNEALISEAIADGVEAAGRTEPLVDGFIDNEDVFDGITGENLTDESLRE
jgi:hypothetical protein